MVIIERSVTRSHRHNTGSGIILGSVRDGLVERSSAHDNGAHSASDALEGPVGIWAYDSTGLVIQHNRSYHNRTPAVVDGSGFGLDQNVSASIVQYNLAYGNDGPGYHAFTGRNNGAHKDNTFRFDISSDDGRELAGNGGLDVHGTDIHDLKIYDNTVVMTHTGAKQGPAVRLRNHPKGVTVRNNILITDGSPVVSAAEPYTPAQVVLQGNDYVSTNGRLQLRWGGSTYHSLADWRAARHQERVGSRATGLTADPCLAGGRAPVVTTPGQAALMKPTCGDVADKGLDLLSLFGVDPGPVDWFGTPVTGLFPLGAAVEHAR